MRGTILTGNLSQAESKIDLGQSLTHLIIYKNNGKYIAQLIEISPTKAYIEKHKNVLKESKLNSQNLKQYEFTGAIIYYDLDYKFLSLIRVVKGRGLSPLEDINLSISDKGGRKAALMSQCYNSYRDVYERECIGATCGEWVLVSHTFLYGYCVPDGSSGGDGVGGGQSPDPVNGPDINVGDGPIPRTSSTMYAALEKFICNGVPTGVTINYNYEPSYLTAQAGILSETGDLLSVISGANVSAVTTAIPNYGVQIWLSQDAFNKGDLYLAAIIGHELVHAKHIIDKGSNVNSNASEYAAYQWTIDFLDKHNNVVKGDPILKQLRAACVSKRNSYTPQSGYDKQPCF